MSTTKACLRCGSTILRIVRYSAEQWEGKKFCSRKCADKSRIKKEPTYGSIHDWIRYHYGAPMECEDCGTTKKRMYHWANLSGDYKRKRSDWRRLCVPCHHKLDWSDRSIARITKLNPEKVRLVRMMKRDFRWREVKIYKILGRAWEVGRPNISAILLNRSWKNV